VLFFVDRANFQAAKRTGQTFTASEPHRVNNGEATGAFLFIPGQRSMLARQISAGGSFQYLPGRYNGRLNI